MREINCPKGCGECCKVVVLTGQSKKKWRKDCENGKWYLANLTRITRAEAEKISPYLQNSKGKGICFFKCKQFDYKTNSCKDYKNRPYMCKYFPFYGKPVIDVQAAPTFCYFANQLMKAG